jgi:hypothetical protein
MKEAKLPAVPPTQPKAAAANTGLDPQRLLTIVAMVFIVGGALVTLRPPYPVNLIVGPFEVAVGIGLLKRHPTFRIIALVWLGILMGLFAINILFHILTYGKQPLFRMGQPGVTLVMSLILFALAAVGYRVLKKPSVQALFYRNA